MNSFSGIKTGLALFIVAWATATVPAEAQTNYQRLKSFGSTNTATLPHSGLLMGRDGGLYGTTLLGGTADRGTVYRLNVDGSGYTVLHSFTTNSEGQNPVGTLMQGQDGALYGTTVFGGSNRFGTVFTVATNGGRFAVLHHFNKVLLDGQNPYSALIQDSNGILYGTTRSSFYKDTATTTNFGVGTIYKLNTNGTGFALLRTFTNTLAGGNPGGLILGQDGVLYGTSTYTTTSGVFRLNVDGTKFKGLLTTPATTQRARVLVQGTNGLLYGTLYYSSTEAVFSLTTNGTYTLLHTFLADGVDGQSADTRLIQGLDGAFYGTTVNGGTNGVGTIFKVNGDGSGYSLLYHFKTNDVDGRLPQDGLVQGSDGTLYGTTMRGGLSGEGTIYSIKPDGTGYSQLLQFNSSGSEGQMPSGSLVPDGQGSLYGSTHGGGMGGSGTVFKMGLDGANYSILRHFGGTGDGQLPSGQLLHCQDSKWYGATYTGGTSNCGTLFKISGDGSAYTPFYNFGGTNDGDVPCDALVQDTAGILYGTTAAGGTNGIGTLFKINANGTGFTLLHTFLTNKVDGASPAGGLVLGSNGLLYGLTEAGGTNNAGSLFKLSPNGSGYTILHHFQTNGVDGTVPCNRLLQGSNGTLYGTTQIGGTQGAGTIYRLNPDGSGYSILQNLTSSLPSSLAYRRLAAELVEVSSNMLFGTLFESSISNGVLFRIGTNGAGYTLIHDFKSTSDGHNPSGRLVLAGDSLYGLTETGGDFGGGSFYALNIAAPSIDMQPISQILIAGSPVYFSIVSNGGPADYQWFFNGAPIPNGTSPILTFTAARTNAGVYSLSLSNLFGTTLSSNATLTVRVPLQSSPPQLVRGWLAVTSAYADGVALTESDLTRFHVQVSSNLTDWADLNSALFLYDGKMELQEPQDQDRPTRFYRFVEQP